MTVSVQTPINEYTGNGSTVEFNYTFSVFEQSDLNIYLDAEAQASGFTVDGIGEVEGGTVTFTEAPANGVVVRLVRAVPLERTTDYTEGAGLSSLTLDNDIDRVWQAIQDLDRDVVRQDLLGTLLLGGVTLSNLGEPSAASDAATKNYVDTSLASYTTDHGGLDGLADDDHTQYHNDVRGDARYYTQAQLTAGQLDGRYYTETETNNLLSTKSDSGHTHTIANVTNLQTTLDGKAASSHSHTIANVTDLQTILDGKSSTSHAHDDRYYTESEMNVFLNGKASESHTHDTRYYTESEMDVLLSGKSATGHSHAISEVMNLQTTLDGKSSTSHSHSLDDLSDVVITTASNGQVLKFNGTNWVNDTDATGGGTPGGSDTQVQFNDSGAFGGDAGLTYNKTTDTLTVGGAVDAGTYIYAGTTIEAPIFYSTEYDAGNSGTSKTINFNNGINQKITMTGSCAFTLSNPQGGMTVKLKLTQGGSGSYGATWTTPVKWAGGSAPTLSTAVGSIDIVSLYYDGSTWFGQFAGGFA